MLPISHPALSGPHGAPAAQRKNPASIRKDGTVTQAARPALNGPQGSDALGRISNRATPVAQSGPLLNAHVVSQTHRLAGCILCARNEFHPAHLQVGRNVVSANNVPQGASPQFAHIVYGLGTRADCKLCLTHLPHATASAQQVNSGTVFHPYEPAIDPQGTGRHLHQLRN